MQQRVHAWLHLAAVVVLLSLVDARPRKRVSASWEELRVPRTFAQHSLFAYDPLVDDQRLVDTLAAPTILRVLPDPFLSNFQRCMSAANTTDKQPWTASHHGPLGGHSAILGVSAKGRILGAGAHGGGARPVYLTSNDTAAPFPSAQSSSWNVPFSVQAFTGRMDALFRSAGLDTVVLMSFSEALHPSEPTVFHDIVLNWLAHCRRVDVLKHVLVVGASVRDCDLVVDFAPCIVHARVSRGFSRAEPADFRWLYAWALSAAGYNVLQADADAVFTQNPLRYMPHHQPFLFAGLLDSDALGTYRLGYCQELHNPCQSTGLTWMRADARVTQALADFVDLLQRGDVWEQLLWNQEMKPFVAKGLHRALPRFGPGSFSNWVNVVQALTNQFTEPAVIHLGFEGTLREPRHKTHLLRCAQLLFPSDVLRSNVSWPYTSPRQAAVARSEGGIPL